MSELVQKIQSSDAAARSIELSMDAPMRSEPVRDLSPDAARQVVLDLCRALPGEPVHFLQAAGRVLAASARAGADVPAHDVASHDGFALADASQGIHDLLDGESRAGAPAQNSLKGREAIAISTGAVVPEGTTAVVPLEMAVVERARLVVQAPVSPGAHIRRAGSDFRRGDQLVEPGRRLRPGDVGALAATGEEYPICHPLPRVALIATGDELAAVGAPLAPGQIADVNSPLLASLVAAYGGWLVASVTVRDEFDDLSRELALLPECDVVLLTGGVSVGEHDHVRYALSAAGATEGFWRLAARPGRPVWFGQLPCGDSDPLVFALPGNPVSAFCAFNLLVAPALRALSGEAVQRPFKGRFVDYVPRVARRSLLVPCAARLGASGLRLQPASDLQSHRVSTLVGCDLVAIVPPGDEPLEPGTEVECIPASGAYAQ